MSLYPHRPPSPPAAGKSEFEILKASHKFLREDEDDKAPGSSSWDDQLATKYYDSLFREFSVCDLKHYKSGNFALRWRTEEEVLAGAGETTCGNTRCEHHTAPRGHNPPPPPQLTTLELPFTYTEHGETKSALVKAVLCARCLGKMMWKRRKEKERVAEEGPSADGGGGSRRADETGEGREDRHRRRSSRSRSPRRHKSDHKPRRRSPAH
ncbi:folate-sensitive fragile site protein Fra10Ac1-domain-containing protein [Roridomyces roridus]|uniref:Folate-sensitive fragile site protein Fra10Ac1-domain-containing protein n=1 Tax=Roridomyces roridus TaxID=1738132 RepID=A0AAD7FYF2_9AGAR|nr:folate-sensitive fragile site protein Fra10Ac1-domain-containing protein [Roridomyces roridus]